MVPRLGVSGPVEVSVHRHIRVTWVLAACVTALQLGCASAEKGGPTSAAAAEPAATAAPGAPPTANAVRWACSDWKGATGSCTREGANGVAAGIPEAWTCTEFTGPDGSCSVAKPDGVTAGDILCRLVIEYVCRTGDTGQICEAAQKWVCG